MNNDDVKKFINISNLYTEVLDVNQKKQEKVDENWFTDAIKGIFGGSDKETEKVADEIIDAAPENITDEFNDLITEPKEEPKAATSDGATTNKVEPRPTGSGQIQDYGKNEWDQKYGATHNADGTPKAEPIAPADKAPPTGPGGDEALPKAEPKAAPADKTPPTGPGGDEALPKSSGTTAANQQKDIDTAQPNAAAMAAGQAGAASTTAPSNGSLLGRKLDLKTPNLMKAYNDGGKTAMPTIRNMQTALSRLGFDPNGLDGKYGNGTFKAVQEFQKANGLSVDGQAGPSTMAAIKKALDDNFEKNKVTPQDAPKAADEPQDEPQGEPTSRLDTKGETPQDAPKAADEPQGEPTSRLDTKGETPQGGGDDAMSADNQQKDIDTAQPNADVDRYIELLNKLEGGQVNAGTPDATQGRVVASYDFRNLIALVESKLNEQLTPAEMTELKALHDKVQGHVGLAGMDDDKITTALNRYLKLVKEPADKADAQNKASDAQLIAKGQSARAAPSANLALNMTGPKPTTQTASKDNNMKKAIKEASMNISINGDSAAEVAELAGILKNAGMHDAKPVSDIMPHAHDGHDDMVSTMKMLDEPAPDDSPCGMGEEGVEEDSWDNSPDETYADTQTMTKDLSGGLNREKKSYPATQDGDNPMAVENSIKEQLWAALNEKMTAEGRGRGKKMKLKASRGNEDIKTTEGSRGKKSRGKKKSRG